MTHLVTYTPSKSQKDQLEPEPNLCLHPEIFQKNHIGNKVKNKNVKIDSNYLNDFHEDIQFFILINKLYFKLSKYNK